jgi:hypothetical protein
LVLVACIRSTRPTSNHPVPSRDRGLYAGKVASCPTHWVRYNLSNEKIEGN